MVFVVFVVLVFFVPISVFMMMVSSPAIFCILHYMSVCFSFTVLSGASVHRFLLFSILALHLFSFPLLLQQLVLVMAGS